MCFCYFGLSILRNFVVGSPLNSSGRIYSWVLPAVGAGCATCQAATMKKWEIRLDDIILMWVKQCHVYHPPIITIFKGVEYKPFPVMGGLFYHCFTHIYLNKTF